MHSSHVLKKANALDIIEVDGLFYPHPINVSTLVWFSPIVQM